METIIHIDSPIINSYKYSFIAKILFPLQW